MLPSIEMIFENVDEEMPVVIIKTFEIQTCVCAFHFFQESWQPKLGKILNTSNEDEPSSLDMVGMQLRVKIKTEKLLGMFLNMCRSKLFPYYIRWKSGNEGEWQMAIFK